MSDVENLKQENEALRAQMANNSQNINNIFAQLEAYKGELADARTIAFQLRVNLGNALNSNQAMVERMKVLEAQIEKMKIENTSSLPANNSESKKKKS